MTQFETLPLSATQANDDDIDPGFLVPDYGNVIPPFDEEIDPDFSVMPPYPDGVIPDRPYPEGPAVLPDTDALSVLQYQPLGARKHPVPECGNRL